MVKINSLQNLHLFSNRKSRLFFVSLLCIILVASALCVFLWYNSQDTTIPIKPPHRTGDIDIVVGTEQGLRDAIASAPGESKSYVIALSADIQLSDSSLIIPTDKNITLVSEKEGTEFWKLVGINGEATITVDGFLVLDGIAVTHNTNEYGRGIQINSYATFIMIDGTIFGNSKIGDYDDGGGVLNGGKFTMLGGTITANTAFLGGGVYNDDVNSIFELCGGTIAKNEATNARSGGGVFNSGEFTMTGGTIVGNTANMGGGVFNMGNFIASNGEISNNIAKASGGGVHNDKESNFDMKDEIMILDNTAGSGGGVYNWGSFYLHNGIISGNTAQSGGGICNSDFLATFVMYDGIISGNTATASNTGGGGIYNQKFATISGGAIVNNKVINEGPGGGISNSYGGIINISNVIIDGNSANTGGGIENHDSTATLSNCIIVNNNAYSDIFGGGGIGNSEYGIVTMSNSEIVNNKAVNGGGIYNRGSSSFYVSDSIIANNTANNNGGGTYNYGVDSVFEMSNSIIANNTANNNGGGTYNYFSKSFEMFSSTVANNTATGNGGGIFSGSSFEMSNSIVANNTANGDGGGITNSGQFKMVDNSVIISNTANSDGGGIYNYGSNFFEMFSSTVANNTATGNGGGIHNSGSSFFEIFSSTVANNTATGNGGGIHNNGYNDNFEVTSSTITNNTANNNGGGIYAACEYDDYNDFIMFDCAVTNNTAIRGGGVYVNTGIFRMNSGEISGNTATVNGGGVWVTDTNTNLHRVVIADNTIFSNNKAVAAYERDPIDDGKYNAYIGKNVEWTTPFTQGYNNYDISYRSSTQHTHYTVKVQDSHATITGAGNYFALETVTVHAGVRAGYTFTGWTVNTGGITLTNSATTTFTMPTNDVTITANWKTNDITETYTVTYQPGTHGTFNPTNYSDLHYGDPTPPAPTPTGETGWTFTGWTPTPSATVTNNAIYTAQWTQTTTTPTPTPTLTPTPTPTLTPTPTGAPSLTPTPTGTPPGGDDSSRQFWALVNLILCIAGVIIAIIMTLYVLLQQKRKEEKQQLQKDPQSRHESVGDTQTGKYVEKQDAEKKHKQYRLAWLAIACIMGIVGIIVFLITEDMKLPMTMVDKWTIINAIIFIVEIIAIIFTFKHKKATTNNDDDSGARMKE